MMPKTHELKTWPDVFQAVIDGTKTHEYRKDDRNFGLGDILHLREWKPSVDVAVGTYTGRDVRALVTHIDKGPTWGIAAGFAVMSIRLLTPGAS